MRVVTFNVHFGKDDVGISRAILKNPILKAADIILIQEIEEHTREELPRSKRIADALGMTHTYAAARPIRNLGTHGLAILSKYPLTDIETVQLPAYRLRFGTRSRIGLLATAKIQGTPVRIANVHLDTRINSADRIKQIAPLVERLLQNPLQQSIIGGDFNLLPFRFRGSFPISRHNQRGDMHEYLLEAGFVSHCSNTGHTFKSQLGTLELDALYGRNVSLITCGVEHTINVSDHQPLWFDVEIHPKSAMAYSSTVL